MNNVILALATPYGTGGISIIRLSGDSLFDIINEYVSVDTKDLKEKSINHCYFIDNEEKIDEILLSKFIAPKSYTGEDVIEINCHGGIYLVNKIIKILLKNEDIELAEPGEFTKRAFLNGKKTRDEVQGIYDLINATNEVTYQMAQKTLNNSTNKLIEDLQKKLVEVIAQIEVNLDYPEYEDIEELTNNLLLPKVKDIEIEMYEILEDSKKGQLIKTGVKTAIIGTPNVGKSSLLNYLSREDKAIVSNIEGTTRDIVESTISIGCINLNILDTAGIRNTKDEIEEMGIKKSYEQISNSELILFLFDANKKINKIEMQLLEQVKSKNVIYIVNKIDQKLNLEIDKLNDPLLISINDKKGLEDLEKKVISTLKIEEFDARENKYLSNINDINKLENVIEKISEIIEMLIKCLPIDLILLDLREILDEINTILGINTKDNLLDELFGNYCLGK